MKITEVETWLVEGLKYNWVLIKIETDEGLTVSAKPLIGPGAQLWKRHAALWARC
jgi:galactonate dehydratase